MRILTLLLALFVFVCCDSDEGEEQFVLNVGFELGIKDSNGKDLLNPENPNSFDASKIKLFYVINGKVTEVNDVNMDHPRNFLIFKQENDYRIRIFLNSSETEETPITYVQWNETDTDTLKSEISRSNTVVKIKKVWLNDDLIWSTSDPLLPYFEIVK